ncbi:MAG TPA: GGDEF domain-containing protein [Treponemataceae bacterium]|nr:GGDEF domain-containing protein [Treponemataceae bacterium]
MFDFITKTRIVFIISLIGSLLLTILGVYLPLSKEIEHNFIEHFNVLACTRVGSFNRTVEKNIQATRALSSRSMIREKILEYQEEKIAFSELSNFTRDKYLDGVNVIENIAYAKRVVADKTIVEFIIMDNAQSIRDFKPTEELYYFFKKGIEYPSMHVISPVIESGVVIAHDIAGFCLKEKIDQLNNATNMILELSLQSINKNKIHGFDNMYEDKTNLYYIESVADTCSAVVHQAKADVFKHKNKLTSKSALFIIVFYALLLALFYIFLVHSAKKQINDLSASRDNYKKHADKDILTGAYSRLFLQNFIHRYPHEKGILIVIDLDNFKGINDTHGHAIGDEVLKTLVSVIKKTIRDDDLVIRYGGDEFLIILRGDEASQKKLLAEKIIQRIKKEIVAQSNNTINFDFSYGITCFESMDTIMQYIQEADVKMYMNKREKK